MNFFHVPSFEDHYTLKIWLKNWNLKINKSLFMLIHNLNLFFNQSIDFTKIKTYIEPELLENIFPNQNWKNGKMKFQLYIKDDFLQNEDLAAHFYRKMHFLFYIVNVDLNEKDDILNLINDLKKFAFLRNINSTIIIAICNSEKTKDYFSKLDNCVVISKIEDLSKLFFKEFIIPLFMEQLRDKIKDSPKISKNYINCSPEHFLVLQRKNNIRVLDGKVLKLRGDISLIFGSVLDSDIYYKKSKCVFEGKTGFLDKQKDKSKLWTAAIYESQSSIIYNQIKNIILKKNNEKIKKENKEIKNEDDIIKEKNISESFINQIILLCQKSLDIYYNEKKLKIAFELYLKLLGFFSLLKNKKYFIEYFLKFRSIIGEIDYDPRIFLYIGDLAYNADLKRMAICSLFECARKSLKNPELQTIRYECLSLCASILKLDVENYKNNFGLLELLPSEITYLLLIDLIDFNSIHQNNEKTLHYYLLIMKKFEENDRFYRKITEEILWEFPFYKSEYDILPYIQRIEPIGRKKQYRQLIKEENNNKKKTLGESVFIYDPRNRNKFIELNWVEQQEAEIRVFLTNPLPLYVKLDSLSLETENVEVANYSNEITLVPFMKNYECKFKIRPIQHGKMCIKGVKIRIGNLIYLNRIDSRGVGILYKFVKKDNPYIFEKFYEQHDINLEKVNIAESVPVIRIVNSNYINETLFYNENIKLRLRITNFSKRTAKSFKILLKIDYENAYTVSLEKNLLDFELDYNKGFLVDLNIYQGENGRNDNKKELEFVKNGENNYLMNYENRNLIERVYKITFTVESKFDESINYISNKKFIRSFKNYKLFESKLYLIDLFGISNLNLDSEWNYIDISDKLQFYFEIEIKFSNISNKNIVIFLRNKQNRKKIVREIILVDKNVIKFSESRKEIKKFEDLNEKYELYWEIKENNRSGIIHFSHPLKFDDFFKMDFSFKNENLKSGEIFEFILKGEDFGKKLKKKKCEIIFESKNHSKILLEGDTIFLFENKFEKNFKIMFTEKDEYFFYAVIKDDTTKEALVYRKWFLIDE